MLSICHNITNSADGTPHKPKSAKFLEEKRAYTARLCRIGDEFLLPKEVALYCPCRCERHHVFLLLVSHELCHPVRVDRIHVAISI